MWLVLLARFGQIFDFVRLIMQQHPIQENLRQRFIRVLTELEIDFLTLLVSTFLWYCPVP